MACQHRNRVEYDCPKVYPCNTCKVEQVCPDCGVTLRPCEVTAIEALEAKAALATPPAAPETEEP